MSAESSFPKIDGYKFIRDLGRSIIGRSALFKCDKGLFWVAKQIKKNLIGSEFKIQSFKSRLDHIAAIRAPCVIPYSQIIETEEDVLAIRQYIEGPSLSEMDDEILNFNSNELFAIWKIITHSFSFLHSHHIAPNTIKPSNIFITSSKNILITDLYPPVIKLDALLHTPDPIDCAFMAPEFFSKKHTPDYRSDLWSLGILLNFILTRSVPFNTVNMFTMLREISSGNLVLDNLIPLQLAELIRSMTLIEPRDRQQIECILSGAQIYPNKLVKSSSMSFSISGSYPPPTDQSKNDNGQRLRLTDGRKMNKSNMRMPLSALLVLKPDSQTIRMRQRACATTKDDLMTIREEFV